MVAADISGCGRVTDEWVPSKSRYLKLTSVVSLIIGVER